MAAVSAPRPEEELRRSVTKRIGELCAYLGIDRELVEPFEIATSGEAVAVACVELICESLSDGMECKAGHDLYVALKDRLALLGRDADRAARIAYPDPFAEHPS